MDNLSDQDKIKLIHETVIAFADQFGSDETSVMFVNIILELLYNKKGIKHGN